MRHFDLACKPLACAVIALAALLFEYPRSFVYSVLLIVLAVDVAGYRVSSPLKWRPVTLYLIMLRLISLRFGFASNLFIFMCVIGALIVEMLNESGIERIVAVFRFAWFALSVDLIVFHAEQEKGSAVLTDLWLGDAYAYYRVYSLYSFYILYQYRLLRGIKWTLRSVILHLLFGLW